VAGPVVLCILDGWGLSDAEAGNAPMLASTPTMDSLMATCPNATLITHGPDAGLPSGQMGNSEVGHTNIGAGRVVAMDLGQIDLAIEDGSFFENPAILEFAATLKACGGTAHLAGLISDGGVHAHQSHVIAAARLLVEQDVPVCLHIITDGRDVAPSSALTALKDFLLDLPMGVTVGSVSGRYYAMDRDTRWDRVEKAYRSMIDGDAPVQNDVLTGIKAAYAAGETDEFVTPFRLPTFEGMTAQDGLFFLNFRADRAREILSAVGDPEFDSFDITGRPKLSALLGMVDYSDRHCEFMTTAYPKQEIRNTLGEWVAGQGKRQFRLAETEKYPHVTFFLNGGQEVAHDGEERYMPASPKVATYDLQPEMSSTEVTDRFVAAIEDGFDLIVTNYANPDMVGHTGDLAAAMAACAAVDAGLARVVTALKAAGGTMIVTADHGNCEMMIDPDTGGPHTAHTLNVVPVILVNGPDDVALRDGRLADLAPTLLALMNLPQPPEMTGESLLV